MKKDAAARAAILASLERQLKKGDKTLVGNKGYRRFLATNLQTVACFRRLIGWPAIMVARLCG
jgi:hypothetical protein